MPARKELTTCNDVGAGEGERRWRTKAAEKGGRQGGRETDEDEGRAGGRGRRETTEDEGEAGGRGGRETEED